MDQSNFGILTTIIFTDWTSMIAKYMLIMSRMKAINYNSQKLYNTFKTKRWKTQLIYKNKYLLISEKIMFDNKGYKMLQCFLQAELIDKENFNDGTCVFRILPAQPKKHRGDEVSYFIIEQSSILLLFVDTVKR